MRKFKHRRLGPVLVVPVAVLGLIASSVVPASAERSGGKGLGGLARASAFALDVDVDLLGGIPLDVGPVSKLRLSGNAGPRFENLAKVDVPPLVEALVLATGAETSVGGDLSSKASARVATVKLHLLGDLLVKVLKSECHIKRDVVEVASDIVFADGSVLGIGVDTVGLQARPNGRVDIPGVGTLILNEQKIGKRAGSKSGQVTVTVNALRIKLDGILGTGDITVAQAMCKLKGKDVGKNLKIVSTTNGHDTSDKVHDDEGDGLLGGLVGDSGGLLNATNLLGGNLLG